jgi:hypothetical protein
MSVYKIIARCPWRKVQNVKKIYENDIKFELYGKSWAKSKQFRNNVEVYQMNDDDYKLLYILKMPTTDTEIKEYVAEMEMYEKEVEWRIKELEKENKYFKDVFNKEL